MAKKIIRSSRKTRKSEATARKTRAASAASAKTGTSKLDAMIAALRSPKGGTIAQLSALTGWQPHSVRGAMPGALKKKRGLAIVSTKTDAERVYRISGKS